MRSLDMYKWFGEILHMLLDSNGVTPAEASKLCNIRYEWDVLK